MPVRPCCRPVLFAALLFAVASDGFAVKRRAFVTSSRGSGNLSSWSEAGGAVGLAAGDAICRARALGADLPNAGTYRAWLSDATGSPSTRFTKSTIPYARRDGVIVANNWADLTDGNIQVPINLSELNGPPGGDAKTCNGVSQLTFTNTITDGTMFGDFFACQNWTSNAPAVTGGGQWNKADGLWTQFVCAQSCDWSKPLYCFMQ